MGIPTVPVEYGGDCLQCYDAGKTPYQFWASVTGIKPGELEPPTGWHCPNGIYLLTHPVGDGCSWTCESWPQICGVNLYSPWSTFGLEDKFGEQAFYKQYFAACVFEYENAINIWDDNQYYGGNCVIRACTEDDPTSLLSVMKLVNIAPSNKTFCELFPISDSEAIFKYCRKSDKTNISIKISY